MGSLDGSEIQDSQSVVIKRVSMLKGGLQIRRKREGVRNRQLLNLFLSITIIYLKSNCSRAACTMKASDYNYLISFNPIIDTVRKFLNR